MKMDARRVVAIVEARMGSTRLPGKSLKPLCGRPLVARVIERIRRARSVDEVVLATSTAPGDDVLAELGRSAGFRVFRGSEEDVLARILGAAQAAAATVHVQCWGDCPFVEPSEIDRAVAHLCRSSTPLDLVANNGLGHGERQLPYGLDVIAFHTAALERAERETRDMPYHREHGTTYIYQTLDKFRVESLPTPAALAHPALDLTINRLSDYEFVAGIYEQLYPRKPDFDIHDVLTLIRSSPALLAHPSGAALRAAS